MNTKLLTIFTRSPLHVGAGSSVGAVDQPIVRERHTRFPVIPGSTIKGVLADLWLELNPDGSVNFKETKKTVKGDDGMESEKTIYESVRDAEGIEILGSADNKAASAGSLLIGEGKLAAFPVRSAKGCWAWLTCPLVLGRLGIALNDDESKRLTDESALVPDPLKVSGYAVFEEYPLVAVATLPKKVVDVYKEFSDDPLWKDNVEKHLAVVSDEMFQYFAQNACEIANHNRIDDKTGVVAQRAFFSQENVPSEAMFYSVLNTHKPGVFQKLEEKLKKRDFLLQIGADMTTGLGWCSVATKEVK